jgi:hypothetical protein
MTQRASKCGILNQAQTQRALDLRSTGASYHEVGRGMGISKTRAYQLVMAGMTAVDVKLEESVTTLRTLELLRLDAIAFAHWPERGNPRHADVILRVMKRRAKLLGLDAPIKVAQTTPGGDALPPTLDLSKLTDAELAEMERLYEKAGAVASKTRAGE